MFKKLKGSIYKELKERIRMKSYQIENINKKMEIILLKEPNRKSRAEIYSN